MQDRFLKLQYISVDFSIRSFNYFHMKTTLDVPETLLNDAMQISGAKTKRAAVMTALEELIRRGRMQALASKLGDSDTFMSSEELAAMRVREMPQ